MKKIFILLLMFLFLMPSFIINTNAQGKTLGDLLDELEELENNFDSISNEKELTEDRLAEVTNNITLIGLEINEIENTIISLQAEIEKLNEQIAEKDKEIRKLVNLMQKSELANMQLEIIFGSENLTELIYKMQIIEQITAYNKNLVDGLNELIEEVKQKNEDLKIQKEELEKQNKELAKEQVELGSKVNILDEDARDILEDIADAKKAIENYRKLGCGEDDVLEICSSIPSDSDFQRPLPYGVITSGYGLRWHPTNGGYQFHAAIDIGGNPTGTSVYAAAAGRVVLTSHVKYPNVKNSSCGGNYVVIQHQIDGNYYATRYMHLNKIYVTENQTVTTNDIIGAVGGGELYDSCTTGPHLDFSIAQGIYGRDFYSFRQPYTINPYTMINFPELGIYYNGRYTKY